LGPEKLGFSPDRLGLHSACCGAVMAMYLTGISVFTIMLLGHWSSDPFLQYIQKQVKECSSGISNLMIRHGNFYAISNQALASQQGSAQPLEHAMHSNIRFNFKGTVTPLANAFC